MVAVGETAKNDRSSSSVKAAGGGADEDDGGRGHDTPVADPRDEDVEMGEGYDSGEETQGERD
jgi:hypothetical protein